MDAEEAVDIMDAAVAEEAVAVGRMGLCQERTTTTRTIGLSNCFLSGMADGTARCGRVNSKTRTRGSVWRSLSRVVFCGIIKPQH